jgi:hypothetical protein
VGSAAYPRRITQTGNRRRRDERRQVYGPSTEATEPNVATFLDNHIRQLVSVDFFTVPTIRFQVLYVFLVLAHERRRILQRSGAVPADEIFRGILSSIQNASFVGQGLT